MSYLTEAFKQLNIIDEDLFPTDSEGLNKLKDFMKSDIDDEDLVVYDETANNEDEIKDSYNGKVILRCSVCKSYFFKEPKNVIIDAEAGLANVGDECCYCHNDMGYNVVGVVAPYSADVSKEDRAEVTHEEPTEVDVEVNDAEVKPEDVNESVKRVNKSKPIKSIKEGLDTNDCDDQKTIKVFTEIYNKYKNKFNKFSLEDDFNIEVSDNSLLCSFCPDSDKVDEDNVDSLIDLMYDLIDDINNTSFTVHSLEINDNEYDLDNYGLEYFDEIDSDILDNLDDTIFINADISEISPKIQEFVDVINDKMLGNGSYGPFGPIHDAEDFYNEFQKSYKFVSGDDDENDTFFENHYNDIYDEWLNTVDIDEYNEEHEDDDLNESVKKLNEETNYDKVMRVLNNMRKEEPIRESLDDINKKLDRGYGRFNLGFVYSLKNPLAFEKAVIEWAKAKSLYVFRTNGYVVSEDIVPKIDSATGKRIEPDIGKWFNNADILFIDNYNTISKEAMPYVLDYMNERLGHVIVTVPEGKISSLDAAAKGRLTWLYDNDLSESVNKVNEDLKDVSITTDDTKIQMTAEENGKVTVTTEPVKNEMSIEDAEVIKPLSAADKDIIADNDGEDGEEVLDDTAIDFDEINDEDLDKLGEKYFTKVYDNVKSFKSTACKLDESGVTLEGKITFKSGKEAKTAFNFNEAYVTKTGKVKLIGENAQFAKNKKAFTLTGSLDNKKLVVESFTYNYRTKDEKTGKSTRLYGTVSK